MHVPVVRYRTAGKFVVVAHLLDRKLCGKVRAASARIVLNYLALYGALKSGDAQATDRSLAKSNRTVFRVDLLLGRSFG